MKQIKDYTRKNGLKATIAAIEMVLGTALTAAAFGLFVIPQNFASAGVTGLATVVAEYVGLSLSQMVLAINMICLLVGLALIGKAFTAKTIASSLLFPLFLEMFTEIHLGNMFSPALSIILAGILLGIGTGLVLHSGASSGGFAVLAVLLKNKMNIPAAATLNVIDAAIILLQVSHQSAMQTICGILVICLSAFIVGRLEKLPALHEMKLSVE